MIEVFVWSFRGKDQAWGHASLRCGTAYVSWWPEPDGRAPSGVSRLATQLLKGRTPQSLASIYAATPFRGRTFADDVADEGMPPDRTVELDGLGEARLVTWWRAFSLDGGRMHGPPQSWHTTERNCSTVVATALREAGGDRYSSYYHRWNLIWHPDDVRRYAESIRDGLLQAGHP